MNVRQFTRIGTASWTKCLMIAVAVTAMVHPATAADRSIARLDLVDSNGKPTAALAMAASQASGLICIGTESNDLVLIDARTMTIIDRTPGHRDRIRSIAFSPRGDRIASAGNDGRLQIWSTGVGSIDDSTAARLRPIQGIDRTPALARVAFDPGGEQIVAVGFSSTIYLLASRAGGGSGRIACRSSDLRAIAHDDRGRLVVAGRGGEVHVFDIDQVQPISLVSSGTGPQRREISQLRTNPGSINDLVRMPSGGQLVSVCDAGMVSPFDAEGNSAGEPIRIGRGRLFAAEPLDSSTVAVAGSDDVIRLVDLSAGVIVDELTGHHGSIVDLAVIDGRLISAGFDATVRVWRR